MSHDDIVPDIQQILACTDLLGIVLMALQQPLYSDQATAEQNEIMKGIKLEAGWILTNLAYGDEGELNMLLNYE